MSRSLPEISKQVLNEDILQGIERHYTEIIPVWAPVQLTWMNDLYRTFHDFEKFMIIMHLMTKTFETYSKNFLKLDYQEFFDQNEVEIKTINVMEISKSLDIPKETARRKINELEELKVIRRINKKIIVDRNTWPNIKPHETMQRVCRFLSTLSRILYQDRLISKIISSEDMVKVCKEYFSYVWKLYYDMQIPFLLGYKKVYGDLESFHVAGTCLSNQALNSKKFDNSQMNKEIYQDKYFFIEKKYKSGINAMSISEITGIPRATVVRKLNRLLKEKFLKVDSKKHYSSTSHQKKELVEVQRNTLDNLSKFAERIYNLCLLK